MCLYTVFLINDWIEDAHYWLKKTLNVFSVGNWVFQLKYSKINLEQTGKRACYKLRTFSTLIFKRKCPDIIFKC